MNGATTTWSFHARNALFAAREQFSDALSGIMSYALFPFFVWLMSAIWSHFNSYQGNFTLPEVLLYVGIGELLFMTVLRSAQIGRSSGDFSLTLARPRSWLAMQFSSQFGRILCNRLLYLAVFVAVMPLLGTGMTPTLAAAARFLLVIVPLSVAAALINLPFASCQVIWQEASYFSLPFSKIFLVLGGVVSPLNDFGQPWRDWLIRTPASDLFFQPAFFCIRGEFYGMSALEWSARTGATVGALLLLNIWLHALARKHHRGYGG